MALVAITIGAGVLFAAPAAANPTGNTGQPNQSCQQVEPNTPGHSANSPGSAFNEPGINSADGGTGGQHYASQSQYDVACYQQSVH